MKTSTNALVSGALQCAGSVLHGDDFVTSRGQQGADHGSNGGIVVDYENSLHETRWAM
jgi:hypothetical protein